MQAIAYGGGALQVGDLLLPAGAGPFPVVVVVHGGCFLSRYKRDYMAPLAGAIAASGFAVWNVEYRRVGDDGGGWPGTFQDVAAATDHLRVLSGQFPLDLKHVVLTGHSAGGELAIWLAARGKVSPSSPLHSPDPLPVLGVVALAPVPDLEAMQAEGACGHVVDQLMGGSPADHPDRYLAASPMKLAPIGIPEVVVLGGTDAEWSPFARSYVARARAVGDASVELTEVAGAGHFDVIDPKSAAYPVVLRSIRALMATDHVPK